MYINLGGGRVVREKTVVGVFDMDSATVSRNTKIYLRSRENKGEIELAADDIPRSFIVLDGGNVIVSDLNPKTVCARIMRKERK